jgi:hypothetical protein
MGQPRPGRHTVSFFAVASPGRNTTQMLAIISRQTARYPTRSIRVEVSLPTFLHKRARSRVHISPSDCAGRSPHLSP